ncbi:MAG: nucleotidyl transferase AbiEii/AbiGii toxin family protein [Deltaproteobacteria bacterium]|nr:nucleotidyl transferase AbiEii/AbiGii toxin family protein [Deltaproteobacteria bacterium]
MPVLKSPSRGHSAQAFFDLPRYSENIDYDALPGASAEWLIAIIEGLCTKKGWEITDSALKYHTLLVELRFKGPDRNFHVKIEISTREKELKTTILPLRGVPVVILEPSFLMTEKLLTFLDRRAGRDIFDAWFILNGAYPLDETMIARAFRNRSAFFQTLLNTVRKTDPKKILRDTGKLLNQDHRNWIQTSFLSDLERLITKQTLRCLR